MMGTSATGLMMKLPCSCQILLASVLDLSRHEVSGILQCALHGMTWEMDGQNVPFSYTDCAPSKSGSDAAFCPTSS